ncbi:MAG TPA: class I SAM-dependent methyltransferase [Pyrinomonadaceae bacterium]|nr:class I SAM-dependent methyltransferase [Pyrinomonadaceae bacterium]
MQSDVTPILVFENITAFQRSYALKSAIELDVFTKIAEGSQTAQEIAKACGASERGIRILCDYMTVLGFLTKENGSYDLTESTAVFLNQNSPAYLGRAVDFLLYPQMIENFEDLTYAVKTGGAREREDGGLEPEHPIWVQFARGMMPMMMPAAQMMAAKLGAEKDAKLKILDIAAGHGIFGIMMAQQYRDAEIYAVDWKNVLEVAEENAQNFGVSNRHHKIEGSAFEVDFGTDYDLVLLTNFLHHFDVPTCEEILRKIHKSLKEGGKVFTLEFVPNEDRVSPPAEAMFSLTMLASTPSGDAYTFSELEKMFQNAGFANSEHHPLSPLPQHLIISTK